jgi:hypothetical protein
LPAQEIIRDYDKLIGDLTRRDLSYLSDPGRCALKYAGSQNIFSENNTRLLKGFGNGEPLVPSSNNKPTTIKPVDRKLISEQLIANRNKIIHSLHNRHK